MDVPKNSPQIFEALQATVSMLNVGVHGSAIRKKLNKYGMFGKASRRNPFLSNYNMAAWVQFAELKT